MAKMFVMMVLIATFALSNAFSIEEVQAMPKGTSTGNGQTASGIVLESMNAAGYTYLLIAANGSENWVAVPETKVEKGATVNYYTGMVMKDFTSKSLDKTFPTIIFSSGLAGAVGNSNKQVKTDDSFAAAIASEQAPSSNPPPLPEASGGSTGAVVPYNEIAIEKSEAANGYTVEELFTKAKELNGKKVQVKGKVVKFSPMIMGKNWIHIQDGSGNPMKNTHDLVITTNESAEVDQIFTFEGILAAEKDFGAGYKYSAIIEKASTIK